MQNSTCTAYPNQEGYVPKDDDEALDIAGPEYEPEPREPHHLTDLGNTHRLVETYGMGIRYVRKWKTWLAYKSGRWMKDEDGAVARLAKKTVLSIYDDAKRAETLAEQKKLADWARHSQSRVALDAMVALAQTEEGIALDPSELDADPWLFNVENGTLDLRTFALLSHDDRDLISKQSPVTFDPAASCPLWDAFLERVFAGDRDLISYFQRAIGSCLSGSTADQTFFMLHGRGCNGKTTATETIRDTWGDYATTANYSTFLASKTERSGSDLARLRGARFVCASEPDEGRRLDESCIKNATGGEKLVGRFLYGEPFEFQPEFKLCLSANHRPTIRGTDHAMWRRVNLIPFSVVIPPEERDNDLKDKLREEAPGILNWALEGCREWQEYGLNPPDAVRAATKEYRDESDTIGQFLEECCEIGEGLSEESSRLFDAYQNWMKARNDFPKNQTAFGRHLTEQKNILSDKGKQGTRKGKTRRLGVQLSAEFANPGDSGGRFTPVSYNSRTRENHKEKSQKEPQTVPSYAPRPQLAIEGVA